MKTVILCHQLDRLVATLRGSAGPLCYTTLVNSREGLRVRDHLRAMPNAEELTSAQLFRDRRDEFRGKYVEFMGEVNTKNQSPDWWAMLFTSKNPFATDLCRNTFYFLLIADLMRQGVRTLVVITDSADLAAQVTVWAKGENIHAIDQVRPPKTLRRFLKQHTPAGIIRASLLTLVLWALSRRFRPEPNLKDEYLVIATATHPSSFSTLHGFRDVYFGPLVDSVAVSKKKALVFALVLERPLQQLKSLRTLEFELPIVPFDSCLSLRSLASCLLQALGLYLCPTRLRGAVEIDGIDLRCLVKRAIRGARHSGEFFLNLRVYHCAKQLSRRVRVARCLYPYENRPWEKGLIQGMRSAAPRTRMVGYQHASVTRSHINFMLGTGEAEITPLPDEILTTGNVTKDWLEKEGNFPPNIFRPGCALRQGRFVLNRVEMKCPRVARVLVTLATSLEEYVNMLSFLEKAFADNKEYDVRVRPHPIIPLESALEIAPLTRRDFYSPSTGSLKDDLGWADVVLYASSTVGLEAVSLGIPAIHLDLGDFLDTDPMFDWDEFKWSVKEPSELISSIKCIEAMPADRFMELQRKGQEYGASYLRPVTEATMRPFWEMEAACASNVFS